MSTVKVIYWSQTGNTEAMANAVAQGIESAGGVAEVKEVSACSTEEVNEVEMIALGCPAMGAEELEETEMEPFMEAITPFLSGKKVALFGSYGWGDGEWMKDWEQRVTEAGATLIHGAGVICMEVPDDTAIAECQVLGKGLVN